MVTVKKLSQYLTESAAEKDRHLTHIEDAVLEGGVNGTRNAINFLIALRDMFADDGTTLSEATGSLILRTKFDGAPAIYAGINPENGKFFVGSKSIFAKNAKLNYTEADIRANHSGGLADKLSQALKYLPELGIKGIVHGDFMFSHSELKSEVIDGKKYIVFRPNTIAYAIPEGTPLANQVKAAKIGIVFHTTYTGKTMQTLQTHFDIDISAFHKTKNVWFRTNRLLDVTRAARLTKSENNKLTSILSQAGSLFRTIPSTLLNQIASNETYRVPIMTYMNQKVRQGEHMGPNFAKEVMDFVATKYNKTISDAKRPETKANRRKEKDAVLRWFHNNMAGLRAIFRLQNFLIDAKILLIKKFNECNDIGTFLHTADGGYKVTTPEGYVAAWSSGGDAVKLVDRMEFSRANFLAIKNWGK
jgi:Family of unknown function (DUF6267)